MNEVRASNIEKTKKLINRNILIDQAQIDNRFIYHIMKRIFDIVSSGLGLFLLSPLFLYVAFKIKQEDDGGSVFFSQNRVGKNGKVFRMYKFRSMCVNAEEQLEDLLSKNEVEGAMFKIKEDPRITAIGKFIRKTSIDELPQFWNVFKGDMSMVGPRPPLEREVESYSDYDMQRLLVKPGCTGLWQVSGRNELSFDEMIELDLKYINKSNFFYDIKLCLKTVQIIIKPNAAY
ncbi:sugar transferase [Enterococcus casseliflavus]|uniref:sugar transferase n=1 Tax=Enterococcus casseliflavus TaxID=37734 RepID=UPI0032E49468